MKDFQSMKNIYFITIKRILPVRGFFAEGDLFFIVKVMHVLWASQVVQWQRIHLPMQEPQGKIPWRKKWQPAPVFLPLKFYGQRSVTGYSPWGCKE